MLESVDPVGLPSSVHSCQSLYVLEEGNDDHSSHEAQESPGYRTMDGHHSKLLYKQNQINA